MVSEGDRVVLTGPNVADRWKVWRVRWTFGASQHIVLEDDAGATIMASRWEVARVRVEDPETGRGR